MESNQRSNVLNHLYWLGHFLGSPFAKPCSVKSGDTNRTLNKTEESLKRLKSGKMSGFSKF